MTTRIVQTIEDALTDLIADNDLTRIDVGQFAHSATDQPYIVTIWFDAPAGVTGCASDHGTTIDEALAKALAEMHAKLDANLGLAA